MPYNFVNQVAASLHFKDSSTIRDARGIDGGMGSQQLRLKGRLQGSVGSAIKEEVVHIN